MDFLLLIIAFGITLLSFYLVGLLAIFPYLWFKDYLHMEKVRKQNRKEMFGEEFLNRGKSKSRYPRLHTISEKGLIFIFVWLPFLTIEILWLRYVWRLVIDVIYPRIMDLIPL